MKSLLPANIIDIPLEDTDLNCFGSLPIEKGKKYIVNLTPSFDFLIMEINGTIKRIDLGDSKRLEQELHKGKTIEMDVIIGSAIAVKIKWEGERLAGGSQATTMKIVEKIKVELKKAMPAKEVTDIQATISKIESNLPPFIAIQDIEIIKDSVSIKKARTWYG